MAADFPQTAGWRAADGGGDSPQMANKDEPRAAEVHCRGSKKKQETKNFSKREENKTGWKWRRGNCILVESSVTPGLHRGARNTGTRRRGTSFNTL